MPDQLAYPSATLDSTRGGAGGWFIVDPFIGSDEEHEVLNDSDDATYVESDGTWINTRPNFLCRVDSKVPAVPALANKLPLRRPYIGATKFALRIRYKATGLGSFSLGPTFDVVDYAGDHPSLASVPAPGRQTILATFTLPAAGIAIGGNWVETEFTLDPVLLKGHDPIGWRAVRDLGVRCYAPQVTAQFGPTFQMSACWVAVEDVERHSATQADWLVIRETNGTWSTQDVKGNWPGGTGPGQKFTTLWPSGEVLDKISAMADAGRRSGFTKAASGTAIVEIHPSVFSGVWSNIANQPALGGCTIGKNGSDRPYIYWHVGTPSSPGALKPVDGLIVRSPTVVDGYRNGNDRASMGSLTFAYDYDSTFVEHGTVSFYGFRFWSTNGGVSCINNDNAGGKPNDARRLDLHDYQLTGPSTGGNEFQRGTRMGGLRFDYRHGFSGRSAEHAYYQTAPTGDSQICDAQNINASAFYPKHIGASSVAFNGFDFHQFVMRTNSCTNNGNAPGCTPQGRGVLLVEDCIGRNGNGGDFKVTHSLGTYINRRCSSLDTAAAAGQACVRCTGESFGVVQQATTPVLFGADYSIGTYDNWQPTTCVKHGGSGLPNPAQPYPSVLPGNADAVYLFEKVVVEDFTVSGSFGDTPIQISGAKEVIIDRIKIDGQGGVPVWANKGGRPLIGWWYWGSVNGNASWGNNGQGPFDNKRFEFRNSGGNPANYYGTANLVAYGARNNPLMDGWLGIEKIPYISAAKLQLYAVAGNTQPPPWYQTQKPDPGTAGSALGHSVTYPCVSAPNFEDPAIYGSYFGNNRRYPNKNTVKGALIRTGGADAITVTIETSGTQTVSVGDTALTKVADPVTVSANVIVQVGDSAFVDVADPITVLKPITVAVGDSALVDVADAISVGSEGSLEFSTVPAILGLLLTEPDVVTDATALFGDTLTGATAVCGAVDGGAS